MKNVADVKWIKLTTDMFDNRKIKHLRRLPEGDSIVLIWVMLLTMAGRCNASGMIFLTENIPYTPKMLADELDFEENTVQLALKALENFEMIITDGKHLTIAGWEEYQNTDRLAEIREQTRKRVAKCREKKLLSQGNVTSNVTVTECNALEEEIEEEIDKEEEKEFHSFNHSAREEDFYDNDQEKTKMEYLRGELGQGVIFMSDEQFDDLIDKLSLDELHKYMGIVAECEKSGQRYTKKTHYQAILDMVKKDRKISKVDAL